MSLFAKMTQFHFLDELSSYPTDRRRHKTFLSTYLLDRITYQAFPIPLMPYLYKSNLRQKGVSLGAWLRITREQLLWGSRPQQKGQLVWVWWKGQGVIDGTVAEASGTSSFRMFSSPGWEVSLQRQMSSPLKIKVSWSSGSEAGQFLSHANMPAMSERTPGPFRDLFLMILADFGNNVGLCWPSALGPASCGARGFVANSHFYMSLFIGAIR